MAQADMQRAGATVNVVFLQVDAIPAFAIMT
jgi:hypothetical protein